MIQQPKKLLDRVRGAIGLKHNAYSTEKTYVYRAKWFVLYHSKRNLLEMGEKVERGFLTYLANETARLHCAPSQNCGITELLSSGAVLEDPKSTMDKSYVRR